MLQGLVGVVYRVDMWTDKDFYRISRVCDGLFF